MRLLITGASGFIGNRVTAEAARMPVALRLLVHERPVDAPPHAELVTGDLAEPAGLAGICDGADAVIHCASAIEGSPERLSSVNTGGTAALVRLARAAGVPRIVYLSTASVYGRGAYRDARVSDLAPAPASETSRTRLAAERSVLAANGIVLRPYLVHGPGDHWVVPRLTELLQALGTSVAGWRALASMIEVGALARALLGAATAVSPPGRIYHANHPEPVPVVRLMTAIAALAGIPMAGNVTVEEARARLTGHPRARHDLEMVVSDHWLASGEVWRDLGVDPGPGFDSAFAGNAEWYRREMSASSCGIPLPAVPCSG